MQLRFAACTRVPLPRTTVGARGVALRNIRVRVYAWKYGRSQHDAAGTQRGLDPLCPAVPDVLLDVVFKATGHSAWFQVQVLQRARVSLSQAQLFSLPVLRLFAAHRWPPPQPNARFLVPWWTHPRPLFLLWTSSPVPLIAQCPVY